MEGSANDFRQNGVLARVYDREDVLSSYKEARVLMRMRALRLKRALTYQPIISRHYWRRARI